MKIQAHASGERCECSGFNLGADGSRVGEGNGTFSQASKNPADILRV